jgi:hypothetical protein
LCRSNSKDLQYSDSKVYTFTEGSCKASPQTEKPMPPQSTPTICTDPAGGCP